MAFIMADRVRETSVTTGLGSIALAGAQPGAQRFGARMAIGDTTWYAITGPNGSWETGVGTYVAANTLERTTPLESSNGDARVNFAAGTKDVFVTIPGKRTVDPATVEPLRPIVTQAQAQEGAGTTPKAWPEVRVRDAAIAADPEVLLASYSGAQLVGQTSVINDLPAAFSTFRVLIDGIGTSAAAAVSLRCGPAGGSLHAGSGDYYNLANGQIAGTAITAAPTGADVPLGETTNNCQFQSESLISDGSNGGYWKATSFGSGQVADGRYYRLDRFGFYQTAPGARKRLGIISTQPFLNAGNIRIYGVRP